MLFADLARTTEIVAATSKRSEKVAAIAALLADAAADEIEALTSFGVGATRQGRIGVGWATIRDVQPSPADTPSLTIGDVDDAVVRLAGLTGSGSVASRRELLHDVLARATPSEQGLIRSILGGELRQGALDGVMAAAVAKAAGVKVAEVQRAAMFAGSLPVAARVALTEGVDGLRTIGLTPGRPVQPMLAATAADVGEALATTGPASVEWKLDGARIQMHRAGDEVRLFTRNLNEVTDRLDGVVAMARALPGGDLVLDGEVLGIDASGAPRRFQDTMGDFSADADADGDEPARGSGLQAFFFDILYDGSSVVDEPLSDRRARLERVVPVEHRVPTVVTDDADEAASFLDRSLAAGHEGVMVKQLDSPYDAGRRGGAWRKVKPVYTLDLVVIAVEWGHGRRRGWLSNLHLAARGAAGEWVMVGKTFKGLTDELLRWQTERFLALRLPDDPDGHVVRVHPEQVVEVAVDGVQRSTRYDGGVALRFARVRRYRSDKSATDADSIEQVRALLVTNG